MFYSIMWGIWNHKNSVVWYNHHKSPTQVINDASSTLFQLQQAQVNQDRQGPCFDREGLLVWKPPPPGWLTYNIYADFHKSDDKSSFGCIVRDDSGGL